MNFKCNVGNDVAGNTHRDGGCKMYKYYSWVFKPMANGLDVVAEENKLKIKP